MKIAVIGAGSWGTAIAGLLGQKGFDVILWARNSQLVAELQQSRCNHNYLPEYILPSSILFTSDLGEAVSDARMIVVATPSHAVRETSIKIAPYISPAAVIISASKGLETNTLKRMSEVITDEIPLSAGRIVALSGPNQAEEECRQHPTATVVASTYKDIAEFVQEILMGPYFRVYTNPDVLGVELGGALKNIIALGAGIAEGLGFGDNTKAALMTRGLAEIARLGVAMQAQALTFAGLAGIGDLIVTCTSKHSRNRRAGIMLAQGLSVREIEESSNMVVEGIRSTLAAYDLAQKYGISMPIVEQTYQVLYKGKSPKEAVIHLMTRGKTHEVEEVAVEAMNWQ